MDTSCTPVFPFSAIVGQEQLKLALLLNAANPRIGGVLIKGEKGTAKSTAVRALANLLPHIEVVQGCPYRCTPEAVQPQCPHCQDAGAMPSELMRTKVVTLPLNATEDRVVGGIDLNQAVQKGRRVLQPGLLAAAHRGILYVDEVNLLDDHIVDVILDTAASGSNVIEREGMSFAHASDFTLVGTMNPEEGDLRPQLLDRFGLCVEVKAEDDAFARTVLMERREQFDADPHVYMASFAADDKRLTSQIIIARQLIKTVQMPLHLRQYISGLCSDNNVAGHRADLVLEQAARTHAALHEHAEVTLDDIEQVADMVLLHRKRDSMPPPPPPPPPPPDHEHEHDDKDEQEPDGQEPDDNSEQPPPPPEQPDEQQQEQEPEPQQQDEPSEQNDEDPPDDESEGNNVVERIFDIGETFNVKKFATAKDRIYRRGSGKRSRSRIAGKQGCYVKSTMGRNLDDVAIDATLRAAAPYQLKRKTDSDLAIVLKPQDLRGKIREKRLGNFLLFMVDASGSMGARGRMMASKGAIMSLLLDAYQKRDKVAMVTFRKDEAILNLPPTSSIELAATLLKEMPVGGRTPLSSALVKSYEVLRNHLTREPTARPIVLMITDGRSNVAMGDDKPQNEVLALAEKLALDERIRFIVVDTESDGLVQFGLAKKLASALQADYFQIKDLKAATLLDIVKKGS